MSSPILERFDPERSRLALEAWEKAYGERIRAGGRRPRRRLSRAEIDASQKRRMRTLIAQQYSRNAPPPDSLRDRRLRLEISLRALARLAEVSPETIRRAEVASEAGKPETLRGPTWRAIAAALERKSGRRVRADDIRRADDHA